MFLCEYCPVWARECCRVSPPCFLAECRKRWLNQVSFVLLCFALFAFSGLCIVFIVSVFNLSCVLYFPACTDVNGTVQPNYADMLLRTYSLTNSCVSNSRSWEVNEHTTWCTVSLWSLSVNWHLVDGYRIWDQCRPVGHCILPHTLFILV